MSEKFQNPNPPAFPVQLRHLSDGPDIKYQGLSMRDYFAAAVLTGMAASDHWAQNVSSTQIQWREEIAKAAYAMADAMLVESAK